MPTQRMFIMQISLSNKEYEYFEQVQSLDRLLKQMNANGFNYDLLPVIEDTFNTATDIARQLKALREKRLYPSIYRAGKLL